MIGLTLALLLAPAAQIAYVSNGDIWTCGLDGKNKVRVAKGGDKPCWSADRKKLCFVRARSIVVLDLSSKQEKTLYQSDAETEYGQPSWGPRFAVGRVSEGQKPFGSGDSILFQPDSMSKPIMQITSNGSKTDESEFLAIYPGAEVESPTWNRQGNAVAYGLLGDVWVSQVEEFGWQAHRLLSVANYDFATWRGSTISVFARDFSWSPDGRRLAYTRERIGGSGVSEVWVVPIKTVQDLLQAGTPVRVSQSAYSVSFTRDGNHLVSEGQIGSVWGVWLYSFATKKWTILVKNASNPAG